MTPSSKLVMCCVKRTGQVGHKSSSATALTIMVALNASAKSASRVLDRHRETSHQSHKELAVCPRGMA